MRTFYLKGFACARVSFRSCFLIPRPPCFLAKARKGGCGITASSLREAPHREPFLLHKFLERSLIFFIIATVLFLSLPASAQSPLLGDRDFQDSWKFGDIIKGKEVSCSFFIQNLSNETLVIKRTRSLCGCTKVSVAKQIVWPQEEVEIRVNFDSRDEDTGDFSHTIYVETDDSFQPIRRFRIEGRVVTQEETPAAATTAFDKKIPSGLSATGVKTFQNDNETLEILMFYSPSCRQCLKIMDGFLPKIKERFVDRIRIKYFDIAQKDNYSLLIRLEERYGVKEVLPPQIFVGNRYLRGRRQIERELEEIVRGLLEVPGQYSVAMGALSASKQKSDNPVMERFRSFSSLTVCGAGLVDGVNPCAFTFIVFFLSFLAFTGYKKRQMVYVGGFFILGVFLTYLLLGLGLFRFLQNLSIFSLLTRIIYVATASLALGLGLLSLYDYYKYKKTGRTEGLKLQLPKFIKKAIHLNIRRNIALDGYPRDRQPGEETSGPRKFTGSKGILRMSFFALWTGFAVSVLESVCTGQMYLPTIVFVLGTSTLRLQALRLLFLYNLMFIIPLSLIFLFALAGVGLQQFSRLAQRHLGKVKIAMAGVFFSLGIFLFMMEI